MSLDAFIHNLHADTDASRPPDWEVDWEDAPLKYKLYRGLPAFPLSPEVALTLDGRQLPAKTDLASISNLLWYVFGLTQLSHSYPAADTGPMQMFRRFIPSGGGLYPNEVYVYLKTKDIPAGVYHYDAAHHRLVMLREGDFDSYLSLALGDRCDLSACFGTVFISTVFWKNFFKYNNFAYRLQGLDTGVLIGQLLEVAKRFGFTAGVYFQFLDRAANHLLGLADKEESVYAVIPLSTEPLITWFNVDNQTTKYASAAELCRELPVVRHDHYERSQTVKEFPSLINMNEASMIDSSESFRQSCAAEKIHGSIQMAYMPRVERLSYDLASICRKRYSPDTDFVLSRVTKLQLAALLQEATASFSYCNDVGNPYENSEPRVFLYACLYNVEGVPDGAYLYDRAKHALNRILPGDHRRRLQQAMSLDNVNLFQVPLCLHVAGAKDYFHTSLGYRGYRIQQMEAGMLVQRLLLAASAIGMGGRPLLGYRASYCDEIYKMAPLGRTSLIQIPIGHYRHRPRLEGSLHS